MKTYTITVNGNVYNVTVEEGTTAGVVQAPVAAPKAAPAAAPAAPKAAPAGGAGSIEVKAGAAGKVFKLDTTVGQAVKKGDPMLKLDLDYLRENAPSVASPVLCTELEDNQKIRLLNEGEIKAGDELFAIDIYEA